MNIEAEKTASRLRMETKRAVELADRLFASQPGGSTLEQYLVAGLERWPGMTTDQHAEISRVLRNRLEGGDEVSKSQVVELKIWLRTKIKKEMEADRTANPKAPTTFALAQEAGVAYVSYDTFRTQYFYPIRDQVREELRIPKPVRKGGRKKGFKTTARQASDEKKEQDRKERAETASAELARQNGEKAAEAGAEDLIRKNGDGDKKRRKRDRRARPIPLRNTLSIADADRLAEGGGLAETDPALPDENKVLAAAQGADQMERILNGGAPEATPTRPPSDPQVTIEEPSLDNIEGEGKAFGEPSPGSEEDRQQAAEDVAPSLGEAHPLDNFPFEHSTELHERTHQELREEYERNRKAFVRDDAEPQSLMDAAHPFWKSLQAADIREVLEMGKARNEWICMLGAAPDDLTINGEDRQALIRLIGIPPIEEMQKQIRNVLAESNRKYFEGLPESVLNLELDSPAGDLRYSVMADGTVTSEITAEDKFGFWALQHFLTELAPRLNHTDFKASEE